MKQMTPRTDAAAFGAVQENGPCVRVVLDSIAAQLETELNETKTTLACEQLECIALRQMVRELRDAFISIEEYWNRDQNETAMADACWYAIVTSQFAITKANQLLP